MMFAARCSLRTHDRFSYCGVFTVEVTTSTEGRSQGAALMLVLADGRDVVVEGGHASTLFPAAGLAAIMEEVPCFNPQRGV